MLIDVTQNLKSISGQPMQDVGEDGKAVDATLRLALVNAVLNPKQNESGMDKVKKYELAKRIYSQDKVELSSEEITLCKTSVGEAFPSPLLVGQIIEMLEGKV